MKTVTAIAGIKGQISLIEKEIAILGSKPVSNHEAIQALTDTLTELYTELDSLETAPVATVKTVRTGKINLDAIGGFVTASLLTGLGYLILTVLGF